MDSAAARRFIDGQRLAASRIDPGSRDTFRDAVALMDALAALGELHPALLELRARDDEIVRARWAILRRKLLHRG